MPKLVAIQADDGFSLVREGAALFFIRHPFSLDQRESISERAFDAICNFYKYHRKFCPEEPWAAVIERIQKLMIEACKPSEAMHDERSSG